MIEINKFYAELQLLTTSLPKHYDMIIIGGDWNTGVGHNATAVSEATVQLSEKATKARMILTAGCFEDLQRKQHNGTKSLLEQRSLESGDGDSIR
ncbi:unnamed protein product [Dracunculus medinensis]|uniref:Craniofacial development protein 2-like n=1 Tax=Dracunculus medinensis TaxID=318479 RepID=A0A0N4URZ2_DRAME|nr:unnamed protein product [Dracunculus medinensis]